MGLKTPVVNGARQDLPCLDSPVIDGARREVAAVEKCVDGAWKEIWSAVKYMKELANTLPSGVTVGYVTGSASDRQGWAIWYFDGNTGSGSVTYYLDGEFVNPTVSFDYDGFFAYTPSGTQTYATVGKIDLYTRTTSGAESYTAAVSAVNVTEGQESFSTTLSGTFDRVGIRFTFNNWNVNSSMSPQYLFNIWNILINGKESIPAEECVIK